MTVGPRWVAIGKVTRLHGVRGCVKVFPYGDSLERLQPGTQVHLGEVGREPLHALTLTSITRRNRFLVVCFAAIDSVAEAQTLVGRELGLPETLLPPTDENEYYHFQLLGLPVRTVRGTELGTLTSILDAGAHDVYGVTDAADREVLLPALADVVLEVNLKDGFVLVDPPEGLLDDL